jgi:hypothetical protein
MYRILPDGSNPDLLFTKVWFGKSIGYRLMGATQICCSPRFGLENVYCVGYMPDGSEPDLLLTKVWFGKCVGYIPDGSEPELCCSPGCDSREIDDC